MPYTIRYLKQEQKNYKVKYTEKMPKTSLKGEF